MSEHMNGAPCSCWPGKRDSEKPLLEIEALASAIYVLGAVDADKYGIRIEDAISQFGWMIRERVLLIDRNLFPRSPVFDENHEAKEAANG